MKLHNPTAGEILNEEFLIPMGISEYSLGASVNHSGKFIRQLINNEKKISKSLDKKICEFFGLSQGYFLGLQNDYLKEERKNGK